MSAVQIIAEAGVNHNGDFDCALALVDAAAGADADIVKFQAFSSHDLVAGGVVLEACLTADLDHALATELV